MEKKENVEFLDFKNNEFDKVITKKRVVKESAVLIMFLMIFSFFTGFITVQYFMGTDIFKVYKKEDIEITTNIKEAYTNSKNGRNLTLYTNSTFKYIDLEKVKEGTYKIEGNKYTLIYENSLCELTKNGSILSSTCPLIMSVEDNDYMTFKNVQITKLLYNVNSNEFEKISTSFLAYINALPVTKKYPSIKASRVDSISDCFSVNKMQTFTCSINYTVIPNEIDLTKSLWLGKGSVVKGTIKKFHYVTFDNTNSTYKFKSMTLNI